MSQLCIRPKRKKARQPGSLAAGREFLSWKDAYVLSLPVPEVPGMQHEQQQPCAGLWRQIVMAAAYAELSSVTTLF
jgi:hypothetical protein